MQGYILYSLVYHHKFVVSLAVYTQALAIEYIV